MKARHATLYYDFRSIPGCIMFLGSRSRILPFPGFCRLSNNDCTSIVDTKYGRIFGISNALAGTIFLFSQTIVLVCTYLNLISNHYAFFMSLVSVSLGAYLIYGLIKLKVKCNVCITVHAINMIVFSMQLMNIS